MIKGNSEDVKKDVITNIAFPIAAKIITILFTLLLAISTYNLNHMTSVLDELVQKIENQQVINVQVSKDIEYMKVQNSTEDDKIKNLEEATLYSKPYAKHEEYITVPKKQIGF